jgi:hypothetical protein
MLAVVEIHVLSLTRSPVTSQQADNKFYLYNLFCITYNIEYIN